MTAPKFLLLLKTRVAGYLTRQGKWVDTHYDKRPTRKPKPVAAPSPAPADDESQLSLFSLLDSPSQVAPPPPEATAPPPSAEKPAPAPKRKAVSVDRVALDYDRPWTEIEAMIPDFGAKEEWKPSQRKKANAEAYRIWQMLDVTKGADNEPLTVKDQLRRAARLALSGDIPKDWRKKLAAYSGEGAIGDSLNEYYTPPKVAAAMWYLLRRFGLERGQVLEPCAGSGVFQETKPSGVTMTAVEWSKASAGMNALMHPEDEVNTMAFEHFVGSDPTRYDAVIGNPPFGVRGSIAGFDKPDLGKAEDYFVDTCLDKTKEGGLVCLVVPHGIATNATSRSFRKRILTKSEVIGIHRLPNTAFAHAGTGVVTDILLLRKRNQAVANALGVVSDDDLKKVGVWDQPWVDGAILDDPVRGHLHGTAQSNWRGGYDVGGEMGHVPAAVATTPIPDLPDQSLSMEDLSKALEENDETYKRALRAAHKNPYPELMSGTTKLINGQLYILQGEPRRWHLAAELGALHYDPSSKEGLALRLGDRIKQAVDAVRDGLPVSDLGQLRTDLRAYIKEHGNPQHDKALGALGQQDPRFLPLLASVDATGRLSDLMEGKTRALVGEEETDWGDLDEVARELLDGDGRTVTVEELVSRWDGEHSSEEALRHLYASDRYAVSLDGKHWGLREDLTAGELYPKLDAHDIALRSAEDGSTLAEQISRQRQWLLEAIQPKTMEEFEVSLRSGFVPPECLSDYFTYLAQKDGEGDGRIIVKFEDSVFTFTKEEGPSTKWVWFSPWYDKYLNRTTMKEGDWDDIPKREGEFKDWLSTSQKWRGAIEEGYNRSFNSFKPKRYGDKPLEIPGWNADRALNAYHFPALRWALEEGKGIISYDVGVGKTPFSIALVAKLREMGQARRPVIVLPKSLTANWAAEIEAFRPGSRVLIIGESHKRDKDGKLVARPDDKPTRDKKWHDITQNDYDYILVTQPAFNEIDVDPIIKGEYTKRDFWVKRSEKLDKASDRKRKEIMERYKQAMADKDFIKRSQAIYWNHLGVDLLIADEGHCFPAGTLVDGRPIETLKVGDVIQAFNHTTGQVEYQAITDTQVRLPKSLVTVHCGNGKSIVCTGNHPFWTQRGYVEAEKLAALDFVYSMDIKTQEGIYAGNLSSVREGISAQPYTAMEEEDWSNRSVLLQQVLHGEVAGHAPFLEGSQSESRSAKDGRLSRRITIADVDQEPHERPCLSGKNASDTQGQWMETLDARWKRAWAYVCAAIAGMRVGVGHGSRSQWPSSEKRGLLHLQNRHRQSHPKNSHRSGWAKSQSDQAATHRSTQGEDLAGTRVVCVEVHERTGDGTFGGLCPGGLVYNIEVQTHHNYFVAGILVHNCYKNLFTARDRNGEKPKFLGGTGFAKRALDMSHKSQWTRSKQDGKGVFFLTATPTKNSPLEVYSMLSHIAPEAFADRGIRHEEDFIERYCEIQQRQVLGTGGVIENSPVVTGFKNMDELRSIMGRYIYRKTAEDVGLKLPESSVVEHFIDMTDEQEKVYMEIRAEAEDKDSDVHIFSTMDRMAKAAMDLSLLDPVKYSDAESPKYAEAVATIIKHSKEGGQIVFADQVGVLQKVKDRLIAAGMDPKRIGIVNAAEAPDSAKRQNLADAFVSGKLDAIIGNTATMGEGMNLQTRTSDIHDLDIPWDPASLTQRHGRGLRQGNKMGGVRLHTYLSKRSFDGYRWQTMSGKKDWMSQLWSGGDRIENPAAQQGVTSRDEFLIMMADDPVKAKEELDKNKDKQMEKYVAIKKKEASDTFRQYVKAKMNHAALKDQASKTAQMAKMRIGRLREALTRHEHFKDKALLDFDGPVLINSHGHPFHEGAAFLFDGGGKGPSTSVDPSTWNVAHVDVEKREIRMRPVGHISTSPHDTGETTFSLQDLESGVTPTNPVSAGAELRHLAANLTHPVALKRFPREMIEEHLPAIQDRLRAYMGQESDYTNPDLRDRKELWGIPEGETKPEKIFPGSKDAGKATYLIPNTDLMHSLYDEALKEQDWNAKYHRPNQGRRKGGYSSYQYRYQSGLDQFHDYDERKTLLERYRKEKEAKQAGMAKSRLVFRLPVGAMS